MVILLKSNLSNVLSRLLNIFLFDPSPSMNIENKIMSKLQKATPQKLTIRMLQHQRSEYFYLKYSNKKDFIHYRLLSQKEFYLAACKTKFFEPINHCSDKFFYTYGVISSPTGSKIDPSNVYLFNSTDGSNVPVKLDISNLSSYSFFNGQIVAVYGANPVGNLIIVEKFFYLPQVNINEPEAFSPRTSINMEVVKGPFNCKIVDQVFKKQSSLYVFMGPFVNSSELYFQDLNDFVQCLDSYLEKLPHARALLVPYITDRGSVQIFPQPAIQINSVRITSCPNPCKLFINSHLVYICNFDNLIDLAYDETSLSQTDSKEELFNVPRNVRLVYHLIFQQTFTPVLNSLSCVTYGKWLDMKLAPDLFILSTKINFKSGEIGPTTVLNAEQKSIFSIKGEKRTPVYEITSVPVNE